MPVTSRGVCARRSALLRHRCHASSSTRRQSHTSTRPGSRRSTTWRKTSVPGDHARGCLAQVTNGGAIRACRRHRDDRPRPLLPSARAAVGGVHQSTGGRNLNASPPTGSTSRRRSPVRLAPAAPMCSCLLRTNRTKSAICPRRGQRTEDKQGRPVSGPAGRARTASRVFGDRLGDEAPNS